MKFSKCALELNTFKFTMNAMTFKNFHGNASGEKETVKIKFSRYKNAFLSLINALIQL